MLDCIQDAIGLDQMVFRRPFQPGLFCVSVICKFSGTDEFTFSQIHQLICAQIENEAQSSLLKEEEDTPL